MVKKPNNTWKRFHDPDATEEQYERWREEHRERALRRAIEMITGAIPHGANSDAAAARALGISPGTIARYRDPKRHKVRRGPLLTTYLMMKAR